jgi:hypothetical protein
MLRVIDLYSKNYFFLSAFPFPLSPFQAQLPATTRSPTTKTSAAKATESATSTTKATPATRKSVESTTVTSAQL